MVVNLLSFPPSSRDEQPFDIEASGLHYQPGRDADVDALNAARDAPAPIAEPVEEQGESA